MEQRSYQGDIAPEGLADFLVGQMSERRHITAQKIGQGQSFIVQIRERHHEELIPALTLGITRPPSGGLLVTLGEQQWITSELAGHAIVAGLIGALITPWALWGLFGPAARMIGNQLLPEEIWNLVETYVVSMGGAFVGTQQVPQPAEARVEDDGVATVRL